MNLNPLTTNRAEARVTILAALEAGTLPAQHGLGPSYFEKLQDGTVCRCAIGQLFPEAEAHQLQKGEKGTGDYHMVSALMAKGYLVVPQHEKPWFRDVQYSHDQWAGGLGDEKAFRELLQ